MNRNKKQADIKEYEKEYRIDSIKNWLGGIIIIGSTLIPGNALLKIFGGLAKVSPAAARLIPLITNIIIKNIKFSKPLFKQIITNAMKKAAFEGGAYGGVYGLGYSIQQDKNFKETVDTITDSVISGIILSVLLSSAALTGKLMLKGKDILYNFDRRKDWGIVFKKASANPELAIKTLLKYKKGFVPKAIYKKGIGNIDFPWGKHDIFTDKGYGIGHINSRRSGQKNLNITNLWENFINTIINDNIKPDPRYLNDFLIENPKIRIAITKNGLNKKRIMPITAYPQKKSAAKRLAALRPMSKPYVDSRSRFTTELYRLVDILKVKNIFVNSRLINISQKKLNKLLLFLLLNQMINKRKNNKNNLSGQSQKPLNMNFAELIKPQQSSTVSYEPFYSERNTFMNNTSNINYGNKKFSANNTIKMQSEKNPALYKGTASKPGVIPNNANGYSLLNTAKASLIPQIEYVLPKFNSPKVELDTSPISRSNINSIAQNDFVSNLNNLNIANNSGQDDDIFSLLINAIKKKNS